jgi:hypothetical protein
MKLGNLIGARGMDRSAARHPEPVNGRYDVLTEIGYDAEAIARMRADQVV